ncbi:MAG: hypothetical protein LC105_07910 [Chitinophagales bacterium]|nr:hypothetical protein [Chitinophagales bacterium]MCZ2393763.1 hypothetical protein [Chitinophagales bacterium]
MHSIEHINGLISQLESLGYFNFSSPQDIEEIKEDLWFGFKIQCFNPTLDETLFSIGKEKRYIMIDYHSVSEKDFADFFLEEIQLTLEQLGVKIQDLEIPRIKNYGKKLCFLINKVNEIISQSSSSSEQFYLIGKDDELGCYLLTPEMQKIFASHINDQSEVPLNTEDWLLYHFNLT